MNAERNRYRATLAASEVEHDRAEQRASRWVWGIVCIACVMPLLMFVGEEIGVRVGIFTATQHRHFYRQFGSFDPINIAEDVGLFLLLAVYLDWPFLAYALWARKRISNTEQRPSASGLAIALGLIGLSVPYVFIWGVLAPFEESSGPHHDAGGMGLAAPFFGPVLGGIGALAGWNLGRAISWAIRR